MTDKLIDEMSKSLLLPKDLLDHFIRSAPYRYKVYEVRKRSGKGMRIIAQPAREVKRLQYWIMEKIFRYFPIHECSTAYVPKKSILDNVKPHEKNPFILKLDFKDFFPSIKAQDFKKLVSTIPDFKYDEDDIEKISRILFWRPKRIKILKLSIGAPSSPYLSNAIMYQFDQEIYNFCTKKNIAYTRYADDMTFSMEEKALRGTVEKKVLSTLATIDFPKLKLNHKKTVYGSKAHRRMVTGLILSNDGKTSLGRDKKRVIQAKIHHFSLGTLNGNETSSLKGLLSFAMSIEPEFVKSMKKKYGNNVIQNIINSDFRAMRF